MNRPKCAVKECERKGFILFGNKWICGEHFMMLYNKEMERKNKQIEELET